MTHHGPNEYAFEVRKVQPRDPGKALPLTYWRRVLAAFDALAPEESLFFRHPDDAPADAKLAKMRANLSAQMKRHRPGRAIQIVRSLEDGGVYLYAVPEESKGEAEGAPARPEEDEAPPPAQREGPAVQNEPDVIAQMAEAARETARRNVEGERFEVAELPPARIPDPEEARDFEDGTEYSNPGVNTLTFATCRCPSYWTQSAVYLAGDQHLKGSHHHERCPLFSPGRDSSYPKCECRGPVDGALVRRGSVWDDRGDWHEASCPLHAHRFHYPPAGQDVDLSSPTMTGRCRCSATQQGAKDVVRQPTGTPIGKGDANGPPPAPREGPGICPRCHHGYASLEHRACKAARAAAEVG